MRVAVNSHALPVRKKNRITSLLCIFETTVPLLLVQTNSTWYTKLSDHNYTVHILYYQIKTILLVQ